jgi:S-adenosylmethionine hydrolase
VRSAGHWFVGPDNGLFELVFRDAEAYECRRVDVAGLGLAPPSKTFHGRDVFAPVAALLASGRVELDRVGPPHDPLVTTGVPRARAVSTGVEGEVLVVDRFGNLVTNVEAASLGDLGGVRVEILGRTLAVVGTYGELAPGGCGAVVGSFGQLEVVERDGSAARSLGAQRGTPFRVHRGG